MAAVCDALLDSDDEVAARVLAQTARAPNPPASIVPAASSGDRDPPTVQSHAPQPVRSSRIGPYPIVAVSHRTPATTVVIDLPPLVASAPHEDNPEPDDRPKDDWKQYEVAMYRDNAWWTWRSGIVDTRYHLQSKITAKSSEGVRLHAALEACKWILNRHECEFKIGMARFLGLRWERYRSSDRWQPTHLFLLLQVDGREAVGYAESALIVMMDQLECYQKYNINRRSSDKGGTGPRLEGTLHDIYFVYLAVKAGSHP